MNHICFPGRVGPATIFIRTPISKRSTLGRILHHRSRNACARAAIRALKLCLTCLLRTFTWNYIAERVPFKGAFAYVARVALAKSKQRFAGHVNVAPFRAAQIRDLAFATKILNCSIELIVKFDLSSEEALLFLIIFCFIGISKIFVSILRYKNSGEVKSMKIEMQTLLFHLIKISIYLL